jgi:hypothetical protein
MTKEINIGAYVTRSFYQACQDIYQHIFVDVIASFEATGENMRDPGQHTPAQRFNTPEKAKEVNLFDSSKNSSDIAPLKGGPKRTSFSPTSAGGREDPLSSKAPKKLTITGVFDEGRSLPKNGTAATDPKKRLIIPCIQHKDFNHIPYLFCLIMNRFWDNLFKRTFLNERMRVRNMLSLQEVLYIEMSRYILPTTVRILEDKEMEALPQSDLFDRNIFDPGMEYELCSLLLKKKLSKHCKMQLQLNICTSAIRVMNKVCKSVYSKKVMDVMRDGCLLARSHLIETDFNKIRFHTPKGKNAELIKLLRFL